MDVTEQKTCDNCYTVLHGAFCHQCGQEKKSYIRNVSGVITEFFGEFSNWDTRVWQTLIPLWFRPGYLSRRYVAGHRVPYADHASPAAALESTSPRSVRAVSTTLPGSTCHMSVVMVSPGKTTPAKRAR